MAARAYSGRRPRKWRHHNKRHSAWHGLSRQSQTHRPNETSGLNMESTPHQGRLLESGTGNSWTLAASWTKRGVVGQALVTPMWNECKMHSHVAQQSRSVLLLGNWRCRGLRYTRCFISVYVCMRTRFRSCRLSNQQTNHAERNSLWECLVRLTKNRNT